MVAWIPSTCYSMVGYVGLLDPGTTLELGPPLEVKPSSSRIKFGKRLRSSYGSVLLLVSSPFCRDL